MLDLNINKISQPAVSDDCETNFWVGDSYCVGTGAVVSFTASSSSISASGTATSSAPHTTIQSTADLPTQTGTISTCDAWYDVVTGDSCESIEAAFNITHAEFLYWNVSVLHMATLRDVN